MARHNNTSAVNHADTTYGWPLLHQMAGVLEHNEVDPCALSHVDTAHGRPHATDWQESHNRRTLCSSQAGTNMRGHTGRDPAAKRYFCTMPPGGFQWVDYTSHQLGGGTPSNADVTYACTFA
jgi:hypothetical protein